MSMTNPTFVEARIEGYEPHLRVDLYGHCASFEFGEERGTISTAVVHKGVVVNMSLNDAMQEVARHAVWAHLERQERIASEELERAESAARRCLAKDDARELAKMIHGVRNMLIDLGMIGPDGVVMEGAELGWCKVKKTRNGRAEVRIDGVKVGFIYTDAYLAAREEEAILSSIEPAAKQSQGGRL